MEKGIIGRKLGMTQYFLASGATIPVTVIEAGPCVVVQKKTVGNEGYSAVQLGFSDASPKQVNKPLKGHFDKASAAYKTVLREFKLQNSDELSPGDIIKVDVFSEGDRVDVSGISKGKGYAGVIKRFGAHRGPASHGSGYHRGQGSMGANSDPSRVMKGKMMPGHMGHEKVSIQNLEVIKVDAEQNIIAVKGAVPGPKGGIVTIKTSVKK